jgi:hypothetical protein
MPVEEVRSFGENTLLERPTQPVEQASIFVFLASDDASYITGEIYGATGVKRRSRGHRIKRLSVEGECSSEQNRVQVSVSPMRRKRPETKARLTVGVPDGVRHLSRETT